MLTTCPFQATLLPLMTDGQAKAAAVPEELVLAARDAAANGDVVGMLRALTESRFLEALQRYMEADWAHLDAHKVISDAVNEFYERANAGTSIRKPMGYLFMTVKKMAIREHEARSREVEFSNAENEASLAATDKVLRNRVGREERRVRALAIARSLLPRIGQETLRNIAAYYLDAVERDATCVDDGELADTFGLTEATARRLKNRALERLQREARAAGISIESEFGADAFKNEDDDEHEDE
jgi:DNA-directed RNA polymerase specialized sigma24 family protein